MYDLNLEAYNKAHRMEMERQSIAHNRHLLVTRTPAPMYAPLMRQLGTVLIVAGTRLRQRFDQSLEAMPMPEAVSSQTMSPC